MTIETESTERAPEPSTPLATAGEDHRLDRFDRTGTRQWSARQAVISVLVAGLLLIAAAGTSIKHDAEQMNPGPGRDLVMAVGRPAAWISEHLPVSGAAHVLTAWLSPQANLGSGGGSFSGIASRSGGVPSAQPPPVTADAFAPADLGERPPAPRSLTRVLVTGDSMSQPLDADLARALVGHGVSVVRDPHIGTGISKSALVDWGRLSRQQVNDDRPQAVIVFIGANEGFSMPDPHGHPVDCCGARWAAIYANRAREMMNTYRQDGAAHVYWLTLPAPREQLRQQVARVVNASVSVAAQPWRDQIDIIDTVPVFTPGFTYRDSIPVGGVPTIVRESDGIHLNDAGSQLASQLVLAALHRDYRW